MINKVCLYTNDIEYNKKFCSIANKFINNTGMYLHFNNKSNFIDYIKDNKNLILLIDEKEYFNINDDISNDNNNKIFILTEDKNKINKDNYIYKLQKINNIIDVINNTNISDVSNTMENVIKVLFINIDNNKNTESIIKRLLKQLSKYKKTLYVNLTDFENYKNNIGLSNVIYNYKENKISCENISEQIENKENNTINVDVLHSVTFPDDLNFITNIELMNIIEEIFKQNYELFFINVEFNYNKLQYLINLSDKIIYVNNENMFFNTFKNFLKEENLINYKKLLNIKFTENNKIDVNILKSIIGEK